MAYLGAGITRFNTADDLTVTGDAQIDTNTLVVDSTNNRVGILNASPATALDVTGTLTADDIVLSNDMTVADNGKVIFGAGSDLSIYHDGSHSYIRENGTGSLLIQGSDLVLEDPDGNNYFHAADGGAVQLYNNGSSKLATTSSGVDVEGNLIAKGYLASEASNSTNKWLAYTYTDNTFRINYNGAGADELTLTSDGNLGIGTSSITSTASNRTILELNGTSTSLFNLSVGGTRKAYLYHDDSAFYISNVDNTPMQLYTNDTERVHIDNSGNVGVNTNSPLSTLHVRNAGSENGSLRVGGNGASLGLELTYDQSGATTSIIQANPTYTSTTSLMKIRVDGDGNSDQLVLKGDGNIGVNTNAPVNFGGNFKNLNLNGTKGGSLCFTRGTNSATRQWDIYTNDDDKLIFYRGGSSDAAIFDSSGTLLIGKTVDTQADAGHVIFGAGAGYSTRNGFTWLHNRLSTDGELLRLQKDSSTVGSIATVSGDIAIYSTANNHSGWRFGSNQILPTNNTGTIIDDTVDLGDVSFRLDDIYATNGTIQTSDENEKQNIASLTSAEITAATAISKLFKTFKWKSKVTAKGNDARIHTGVIAQQVQTAMSDAGLDASKYAFWCSNTWWTKDVEVAAVEADEEKGIEAQDAYTRTDHYDTKDEAPDGATEHTRMGIRYPELLAFIGAATEQRLTSIETRLTALEAN